jgi:predicted molibdopterin-dependent oxidoreductase YjgC
MAVFLAMAHVILREGWADTAFIEARTEGFAEFAASVAQQTPAAAELVAGVPAEQIEQAARLYALGERQRGLSAFGDGRGHSAILYAMGITQRRNGTELVLALANLALMTGQIGRPATGVNPLRGQSNVQGACDVGALPNVLPGYLPVGEATARATAAAAWGVASLPETAGLTVVEMMHAAAAGQLRAMLIMGENPMLSDPNIDQVEVGLRRLDFLAVQEIFLSETAQLAQVVLPATASLEKDGTMTNTERRIQRLTPVVAPPGAAWSDWRILAALGRRLDQRLGRRAAADWSYSGPDAIMTELASVTPIYGGIRYERLTGAGLTWPCPTLNHPGTPMLHREGFTRGRGRLSAVPLQLPAEQPDADYPLVLTTGRVLYHYHTGTMTRRSGGLDWREPRGYAEISAADAAVLGLRDGGPVVVRSRRGAIRTQARISRRVPAGTVFLSFHWREAPANRLTQDAVLDPQAKIPEYKICAVRLENPSVRRAAASPPDSSGAEA